jgi:hypothetical protein
MAKKYTRSIWEVTVVLNGVILDREGRKTHCLNQDVKTFYTLLGSDESNTLKGFASMVDDGNHVEITLTKDFDALYQKYETEFADYYFSL